MLGRSLPALLYEFYDDTNDEWARFMLHRSIASSLLEGHGFIDDLPEEEFKVPVAFWAATDRTADVSDLGNISLRRLYADVLALNRMWRAKNEESKFLSTKWNMHFYYHLVWDIARFGPASGFSCLA